MTAEELMDDKPLESEYEVNEEPIEDIVVDPFESEYPEEYELEEPMIIPQSDYDMVLEKGERIKIISKEKVEEDFDYTEPAYEAEGNELSYHGKRYFIFTKDDIKNLFTAMAKDLPSTLTVSFHGRGESRITSILFPKKIIVRGNTIEVVSKINSISSGYFMIVLSEIVMITSVNFGKTLHFMVRPNVEVSVAIDDLDVEI